MIRFYEEKDKLELTTLISDNILQNVYLYIDSISYGFCGENVNTWILEKNNEVKAVFYQYYDSFQIIVCSELYSDDYNEIIEFFLKEKNIGKMISGPANLLKKIGEEISGYEYSEGVIMKKSESSRFNIDLFQWAEKEDCIGIAKLICSCPFIGSHYTEKKLEKQLLDRMKNHNCKNLILKINEKIEGHIGVFASSEKLDVLGGLIVNPELRGKQYGKRLLETLAASIIETGKIPVFYCYDEKLIKWYSSLGWNTVSVVGKLEWRN